MSLTVAEAARALGLSRRRVCAMLARGELRAAGRRWGRRGFVHLVHLPDARPSIGVAECARALGCSERTVRDLVPDLAREGHAWRTHPRSRWRIARAWVYGE